jgi:hypothetical protein
LAASSDDDSDPKFNPDCEIVDGDGVPVFLYDQDVPELEVGVVFLDTKECKPDVLHHVILHDHTFHAIKMDTTRFTTRCMKAYEGCMWRFHTSTGKGYIGCKVNYDIFLFLPFICS